MTNLTVLLLTSAIGMGILPLFNNRVVLRLVHIFTSILLFAESLILLGNLEYGSFVLTTEIKAIESLRFFIALGIDSVSAIFIVLTTFIFALTATINMDTIKNLKWFLVCLIAIEFLSMVSFASLDVLLFYIAFEAILIPMFILIGVWGARERKIKAAYYFFLYTLFGSLFMLFAIFNIYYICRTTHYDAILSTEFTAHDQRVLWICFFIAFSVKIPTFPFHVWLPEAHVEAPTVGSVILASLLLKLGGFGFIRYVLPILPQACEFFSPVIYSLAIVSIIYGSLAAIRQIDLKKIIAYSSVAHMNVVVLGLFSNTQQGLDGAMYLMVAHGIVSGALFFCVGILYDRYHTRLLKYYSGLTQVMPAFAAAFFVFTLANMGFPGTANFIGELLVFLGLLQTNVIIMALASTGVVLSAIYSIWLFGRACFGALKIKYIHNFVDINKWEVLMIVPLIYGTIAVGLYSGIILNVFDVAGV